MGIGIISFLKRLLVDTFIYRKFLLFTLVVSCIVVFSFLVKVTYSILLLILFILFWKCYLWALKEIEERESRKDRVYWLTLSGWKFEQEVAKLLRKNGYERVQVTKGSGDGGIDIICYKGKLKFVIQCKNWTRKVQPLHVRATYAVKEDFDADVVILLASSGVTEEGMQFIANKRDYILWTLKDIIGMSRGKKK